MTTFAQALSFDQYIESYQKNSSELMSLRSEIESSRSEYKDAVSAWLPQLSFNLGYLNSETPAASRGINIPGLNTLESKRYAASLDLNQSIYAGGRILSTINVKKSQLEMSQIAYQNKKQNLTQQSLFLALDWKFNAENLKILEESLKMQKRFLYLVDKRLKNGLARQFDFDKTLGDKISYELRIEQLKQANVNILQQLMTETQLAETQLIELQLPEVSSLPIKGDLDKVNNNWNYKAVVAEKTMMDSQLSLEMSKNRPQINIGGSLGRESLNFSGLKDGINDSSSFYVNLKVPLFSGFSSTHLRKKTKQKNFAIEKKQKDVLRNMKVKAGQIRLRLEKNKNLVAQSDAWKKAAFRGLRRVLSSYKLGQVENSQVVLMQSDYERASVSSLNLVKLYYQDFIAWNSIQGNNIEDIF